FRILSRITFEIGRLRREIAERTRGSQPLRPVAPPVPLARPVLDRTDAARECSRSSRRGAGVRATLPPRADRFALRQGNTRHWIARSDARRRSLGRAAGPAV